ncbi:hypothetical protein DSO57_1035258 [Entomophthora muscae]|nr:hypothetical protein DSO57_1035258 [Entomophthora muscae]
MAALVGKVAAAHRVETVIDLGSGQGYLSRLLAFQHGLNVLGVDGDPAQSAGAYRIDAQFAKRSTRVPGELSHSTLLISPASLPQLQRNIVDFNGQKDWLLCGLHTCGSLAYTTIDLFFKTDAKCLVTVACCYNRLTVGEEFPTSSFLKERSPRLGRLALKMACQTPSSWPSNPEECFEFFKRHFYRALLQKLMVEIGLISATQAPPAIGKLKKNSFFSFQVYAHAALVQLGYPVSDPEGIQAFYEKHRAGYRQIALVWSLQSCLAPVIESLLILDRYISIRERLGPSGDVTILPMFDLLVSPRCFALVAHK